MRLSFLLSLLASMLMTLTINGAQAQLAVEEADASNKAQQNQTLKDPVAGKNTSHKPPLDTSLTQPSSNHAFNITLKSQLQPVSINQMHQWIVHIETHDGKPVEGAQISFDGRMPEHRHGLPTVPRVTKHLGNGDYLVEGVKFSMKGWWQMRVDGSVDGQSLYALFNLIL